MNADSYLILVRFGHQRDFDNTLGHIAKAFGTHFDGEICAYGKQKGSRDYGRFKVHCIWAAQPPGSMEEDPVPPLGDVASVQGPVLAPAKVVVSTYDPFQSGLIGLMARFFSRGRLICEVNGDYFHPVALDQSRGEGRSDSTRSRRIRLGEAVLGRADGVKYLFPGQLDGFDLPDAGQTRVAFPNLINTDIFKNRDEQPEPLLLFVGHPFYLKGGDVLLRAFAEVAERFPEWSLLMVGHRVEEGARSSGVPIHPRIGFSGPVPPDELAALMSRSSALVLASRTEAMGRVLVEAAVSGRPRIASRVGGVASVVEHDVDGLLFASEDVDELASTLATFMSDSDLRERLGKAAGERARRDFTSSAYADRYAELISAAGVRS